jgi:hypothetical protein
MTDSGGSWSAWASRTRKDYAQEKQRPAARERTAGSAVRAAQGKESVRGEALGLGERRMRQQSVRRVREASASQSQSQAPRSQPCTVPRRARGWRDFRTFCCVLCVHGHVTSLSCSCFHTKVSGSIQPPRGGTRIAQSTGLRALAPPPVLRFISGPNGQDRLIFS